ncbi:MAG: FkbM family methyltransferase [Candidatus Tectomicrobia bacterium]|uniref:FkbM family methyltransferase n=1 Tax=Tectimicrobiota bacterium TaxID=2528274 RepID=A0A933GKI4_UNCTE|nr:FkbM family methyltransferase [Candidatus Tectomicrobia bacterium]
MALKNINLSPRFTKHLVASRAFERKPLVTVDVGARGGFEEHWSCYGDQMKLIGFEADVNECERLNRQESGLGKRFYPVALHQNIGRRTFYCTAYPAGSGFYQPDMKQVQRFPDKVNLAVVKTIELDTAGFDSFASDNAIDYVDFLKLDTESTELDILKGAARSLKKSVIGLSIEIWFQPWHIGQPVFCDVYSFLRPLGFRLFDLALYRMSREALPEATPSLIPGPTKQGQVISGEALYLRDGASEIAAESILEDGWDDIKILKLASIMELFCLPDCAAELIQVAHRQGFIQNRDVNNLADLLVPGTGGKYVSYSSYLENIRNIKQRGYASNTQRAKSLIPLGIRKIIGVLLIKIRDKIDSILK